jgi:DNA-directed RNA polymerase subunit RPC12/RpoP
VKFLCLDCDQPMKLHGTEGPDEGSLTVTFRCPECGFRVAMLTNPFETQMVRSLGVKVGGRTAPPAPFEHLRSTMAGPRPDAFAGGDSRHSDQAFAAALARRPRRRRPAWAPEPRRLTAFPRSSARWPAARSSFAEDKATHVTGAVMDEARRLRIGVTRADLSADGGAAGYRARGGHRRARAMLGGVDP